MLVNTRLVLGVRGCGEFNTSLVLTLVRLVRILHSMILKAGTRMSGRHRKAISNSCKTKKHIRAHRVDGSGEARYFNSITDSAQQLRVSKTSISHCINGRQKSAGGWVFEEV